MKGIEITYATVGLWKENCYLIQGENSCILIDPGDEFDYLDKFFFDNEIEVNIQTILCTHGHFDHVGAAAQFQDKYNAQLAIHSKDKRLLAQNNLYRKIAGDNNVVKTPKINFLLDDLEYYTFEDNNINIYNLPGHSNGSVCFEIGKNLISGDILLENELGRNDLPGGNREKLVQSVGFILDKFFDYRIFPGHGAPFILDGEKADFYYSLIQ